MTFVGTELTLSNGNTVDLAPLAGSNTAIDDPNDVDTTAVTVGQGLRWNGTQWVPYIPEFRWRLCDQFTSYDPQTTY